MQIRNSSLSENIPLPKFWTKETSSSSSSQAFFGALAHFETS